MGPDYYDNVLDCLQDKVDRRYEINSANPGGAVFEKVAKVLSRMAVVHEKRKDYDNAIEWYNKSLLEDNSRPTRNALRDVERLKEKHEAIIEAQHIELPTANEATTTIIAKLESIEQNIERFRTQLQATAETVADLQLTFLPAYLQVQPHEDEGDEGDWSRSCSSSPEG